MKIHVKITIRVKSMIFHVTRKIFFLCFHVCLHAMKIQENPCKDNYPCKIHDLPCYTQDLKKVH
jgi:hypothetical protein